MSSISVPDIISLMRAMTDFGVVSLEMEGLKLSLSAGARAPSAKAAKPASPVLSQSEIDGMSQKEFMDLVSYSSGVTPQERSNHLTKAVVE